MTDNEEVKEKITAALESTVSVIIALAEAVKEIADIVTEVLDDE